MKIHIALLLTLFYTSPIFANLEVSLAASEASSPNKAVVTLAAKNTFSQPIQTAKAWVFAMDAEGRVVGQKSAWILQPSKHGAKSSDSSDFSLDADKEAEFSVALNTERHMVSSKVIFTKLILADGTSMDPRKHVVSAE
ncbi:MAG: hypothetical protein EA353_06820 [Puniceicoccaceae bacterium]|nr:MAG: hypothetical protein EA353_06820 [Puniceicoccaceae bacterium]